MISVITIVKNDLSGLQKTYASLLTQGRGTYSWVIVDSLSTDGTYEWIHSLGQLSFPMKYIYEKDSGVYDAMNKGVLNSGSNYCIFMNAGDIFFDEKTLSVISGATKSNSDVYYGHSVIQFQKKMQISRKARDAKKYIMHGLPGMHQSTVYSTEVIRRLPYDIKYRICGDYHMAAQLFVSGCRYEIIDHYLSVFGTEGLSTKHPFLLFKESMRVQRKILKLGELFILISYFKKLITFTVGRIINLVDGVFN